MLGTYRISGSLGSYSNSIFLDIYSLLGTYSYSASIVTWHMYLARHLKFTWHLLNFWLDTYYSSMYLVYLTSTWNWLSVLTLNCQNQSETNNISLWHECQKHLTKHYEYDLYEYIIHHDHHMYKTSKTCSKFCKGLYTSKTCNSR